MTLRQSKSDILFDRLRHDILSLDLPPGMALRLPALSERYAIGLTPLRECLNRLAAEKLVVPEHNKGFCVIPLTRADLLDLERSRDAIEGAMLAHSVSHADDTWEAGVIGAYHHLSQTPVPSVIHNDEALAQWTRRHLAFHQALVAGARSDWMARFAGQLQDQLGRYHRFIQAGLRDLTQSAPPLAAKAAEVFSAGMALEPHRALYQAALDHDPAAALAAFRHHTGLSIAAFEELSTLMPAHSPFARTLGPQSETPV
ncbi:GntR family transcriptional regulator [Sulfitobacter sp. PM12]|uniref:GntR family transcriptional regulator n=1 Tax=Sulfitobacter sp. PM12 TaxID=3138497 RepID=UPI003890C826